MQKIFQKILKVIALVILVSLFSSCFATRKKNRCGDCPKWKIEIFELFTNFNGFISFFLLDDLLDEKQQVKFYLPFDNFASRPIFTSIEDYMTYKKGVMKFIAARNLRVEVYAKQNVKS